MAYTFSDLKSELKTELGDQNMDSTMIGNALNYTQNEIFNKFELTLNTDYTTTTLASGSNVPADTIPTNLQKILSLYITNSGEARDLMPYFLTNKDFRQQFPVVDTTNPIQWWTFFTEYIEFSTLADKTYNLRIEFIKTVDNMADDSDIPTIPQAYKEMLMLGAKIRLYENKEDFDYANQFYQRYADLQEQFVARYSTSQVDAQFIVPGSRNNSFSRVR